MIAVSDDLIRGLFVGDEGVDAAYVGDINVYPNVTAIVYLTDGSTRLLNTKNITKQYIDNNFDADTIKEIRITSQAVDIYERAFYSQRKSLTLFVGGQKTVLHSSDDQSPFYECSVLESVDVHESTCIDSSGEFGVGLYAECIGLQFSMNLYPKNFDGNAKKMFNDSIQVTQIRIPDGIVDLNADDMIGSGMIYLECIELPTSLKTFSASDIRISRTVSSTAALIFYGEEPPVFSGNKYDTFKYVYAPESSVAAYEEALKAFYSSIGAEYDITVLPIVWKGCVEDQNIHFGGPYEHGVVRIPNNMWIPIQVPKGCSKMYCECGDNTRIGKLLQFAFTPSISKQYPNVGTHQIFSTGTNVTIKEEAEYVVITFTYDLLESLFVKDVTNDTVLWSYN